MIQGAALMPMIRWMAEHGRPVHERLSAVDLGYFPFHDVSRPIPLVPALALFRQAAQIEGPDIGCRVVSSAGILEIAMMGKVALGARTPREALIRAASALPYFSTHEHLVVETTPDAAHVRQFWGIGVDAETLHTVQQFIAKMIETLCAMTGARSPLVSRIEMTPHPVLGFRHLKGRFDAEPVEARGSVLEVEIDRSISDRAFRSVARDRFAGIALPEGAELRGDGSLASSAMNIVRSMLDDGAVTAHRLAKVAGLSVRTLQRRLADEGTTFSKVLEDTRRKIAFDQLGQAGTRLTDISNALGYSRQSVLTRAVRRWTGRSPRDIRTANNRQ